MSRHYKDSFRQHVYQTPMEDFMVLIYGNTKWRNSETEETEHSNPPVRFEYGE